MKNRLPKFAKNCVECKKYKDFREYNNTNISIKNSFKIWRLIS